MIKITDVARDKIIGILNKNPGKFLRIVVEGDGCAGPYLGVYLDEAGANEVMTKVNGIDILISDAVKRYAEVTTINVDVNHIGSDSPF
jgi:Fe-S cluster assembly iron-binding protein IscA